VRIIRKHLGLVGIIFVSIKRTEAWGEKDEEI